MQTLRQLTPQDVLFVGGETSRIYQHTVGLMLIDGRDPVSYTHLRAHETVLDLVCRLLLENKKKTQQTTNNIMHIISTTRK